MGRHPNDHAIPQHLDNRDLLPLPQTPDGQDPDGGLHAGVPLPVPMEIAGEQESNEQEKAQDLGSHLMESTVPPFQDSVDR